MTREEAIEVLTDMRRIRSNTITEACDMAISALHFEADCRSCMWREKYEEQTEPSDFIRQETIKELGDWLEQMIQHGVPSHSAKRKALANAIALLSMDTHEIHTETHECVKETHDSDLISRAEALAYPLSFDHYDKENGSREFICGVESYREYIQHLPSVSVESKATENKYDCDLISRAEAKQAIRDKFKDLIDRIEINEVLNELPSVSANSDDLIIKNGKGIQDGLYNIKNGEIFKYKAKGGTVRAYKLVPSVSAERVGEWVERNDFVHKAWECSKCGHITSMLENYCCECGAKMK